ncbi:MAG: N-acetylmuramoyl-L-alanine amidase [Bacteroidota bacterium]
MAQYCLSEFLGLRLKIFSLICLLGWGGPTYLKAEIWPPESESVEEDYRNGVQARLSSNIVQTVDGVGPLRKDRLAFFQSQTFTIPISKAKPFLTFSPSVLLNEYKEEEFKMQARFSPDGQTWGEWQAVRQAHDLRADSNLFVGNLLYLDTSVHFFEYLVEFSVPTQGISTTLLKKIRFNFFSPGDVTPVVIDPSSYNEMPTKDGSCNCPEPAFASRTDWNCPDGQNPSCSNPVSTTVSHLIVHHSAGTNSSSNWAATVLSIWQFHTTPSPSGSGFCDIGYNWLIDPNGTIYEGRGGGDNIRGAHFCGTNTGTMGVCLLGNFESATPTQAALNSLKMLLAWKGCKESLSPADTTFHSASSKNLPVVSGHRNGCATACPGENLFAALQTMGADVQTEIDNCSQVASIDPNQDLFQVQVFPNPSQGELQLIWEGKGGSLMTVECFTGTGVRVWESVFRSFPGKNEQQLKLPAKLPQGMYFLKLSDEERMTSQRFLLMD